MESPSAIFTFAGHQTEGFAMDWSKTTAGKFLRMSVGNVQNNLGNGILRPRSNSHIWRLSNKIAQLRISTALKWKYSVFCFLSKDVTNWKRLLIYLNLYRWFGGYSCYSGKHISGKLLTGDCVKNIHQWTLQGGTWHVDQRPFVGHTASVEDIQWSPNEVNVSEVQECIPVGCAPPASVVVSPARTPPLPHTPCHACPPPHTPHPHPPPPETEWLTYASENITLHQTLFAGGKNAGNNIYLDPYREIVMKIKCESFKRWLLGGSGWESHDLASPTLWV